MAAHTSGEALRAVARATLEVHHMEWAGLHAVKLLQQTVHIANFYISLIKVVFSAIK